MTPQAQEPCLRLLPGRILRQMTARDLDAAELAEACDMTRASIMYYLTASRTPNSVALIRLSRTFGVSTDYLLGITDDPTPSPPSRHVSPKEE